MTAAASVSNIDLSTTLGKKQRDGHTANIISLTSVVYNASGPRTGTSAAMAKIASSEAGGVLAKSATLAPQKGNDLPR